MLTTIDVSCNGNADGQASVLVSGGSAPYTYTWTDASAQTTSSATGLSGGTYSVTIMDNGGMDSTVSALIDEPALLTVSASITNLNCKKEKGSISSSVAGGTSPYAYSWSTGAVSASISDLEAGTYTLTFSDANNCIDSAGFSVKEMDCNLSPVLLFTPNGDGINDVWNISGIQYYENCLVIVYDRWGQKVYEQKNSYTPWDGKTGLGIPVPDASYYYVIFPDKDNERESINGVVSIVK